MRTRWIATLVVMVGAAGPALGQTASVTGVETIEAAQRAADETGRLTLADCDERYRSLRARSEMQPSERRAALAICRLAAQAETWPSDVARRD